MYELIQLTERTYYIKSPTNIGLFRLDEKNVCLIDSGNDKDAGRRIRQVLDANGWQLTAIYNTHANADHIGGNRYLQGQTGCRIYAPGIDCAFTRHPVLEQLNQRLGERSDTLRRRIALYIEKRIQYAYPAAARQEQTALRKGEKNFLSVSDLLWLFVIGAFLGDMVETVFCRVTAGVWMSRSSLVWGPFSVVWGLALVLATVLLRQEKDRSDRYLFAFGTVMGGVYEYVCSAVTELLFGTVFWDYSKFKFNLGGRINLLYCFFWGIAAVIWMRYGYPLVLRGMKKVRSRVRPWMTALLAVFMAVNMLTSALALARYDARTSGEAPKNSIDMLLDAHFDDARMERIYPNAKKVAKAG